MTRPAENQQTVEAALDRASRGFARCADFAPARAALRDLVAQLDDAKQILREKAYLPHGAGERRCIVCGWPEGGHTGLGRYKRNEENTHEQGCSLDELLNDRPAYRLRARRARLDGAS